LHFVSWPSRADRIKHDSAVLVWRQVADDLTADIRSGELPPGARLPSEVELAEIYGVARVTIRRAVAELRKDGLVVVVHGRGTFVRE
jgi:DNA-binding GntR family transcriptional regulator